MDCNKLFIETKYFYTHTIEGYYSQENIPKTEYTYFRRYKVQGILIYWPFKTKFSFIGINKGKLKLLKPLKRKYILFNGL